MGLGIGECCCTTFPPPTGDDCETSCCEEFDTPGVTFSVWLQSVETEDLCYECDPACDTTPFELELEQFDCGAANPWDGYLTPDDSCADYADAVLWATNNDAGYPTSGCVQGCWGGAVSVFQSCTVLSDILCDGLPEEIDSESYAVVLVFVYKLGDGSCLARILFIFQNYRIAVGGSSTSVFSGSTYEVTLGCCTATNLVAGPYTFGPCTTGSLTGPSCWLARPVTDPGHPEYDQITMNCP